MKQKYLSLLLFVGCAVIGSAQPDVRLCFDAQLDVGGNFATFKGERGVEVFQQLGSAVDISAGLGVRYKEVAGVFIAPGFLLDTYIFSIDSAEYDITNFVTKMRLGGYGLVPLPKTATKLHLGLQAGLTFFGEDTEQEQVGMVKAVAESFGPRATFVAPEVGITRLFPRGSFSILATYLYHNTASPSIAFSFSSPAGDITRAEAQGNYLGLRFRYIGDIRPPRKPRTKLPSPPIEAEEFAKRETRSNKEFSVKRRVVKVHLYDNADIDGDTVSVAFNGAYILTDYPLQRKKKTLKLYLEEGANTFTVYAKNEGSVSPNTAACEVRVRGRKQKFVFSTNLDRNETLVLNLD
jgi:hypothetical protein